MTSVVPASSSRGTQQSTDPFEVIGAPNNPLRGMRPSRGATDEWSFGPRDANPVLAASALVGLAPPVMSAPASNTDSSDTAAPQRVDVPDV
jgi:hypothetical protein